jgi:hypothetical protein
VKFIDLVILFFNLLIFGLATAEVGRFRKIQKENALIQRQIEDLVQENTRMADLMLDEWEAKMDAGKETIRQLDLRLEEVARTPAPAPAPPVAPAVPPVTPAQRAPAAVLRSIPRRRRPAVSAAEKPGLFPAGRVRDNVKPFAAASRNYLNPDGPQVLEWMNQGASVLEISRRLNLTQGEVLLKLNLEKKRILSNGTGS